MSATRPSICTTVEAPREQWRFDAPLTSCPLCGHTKLQEYDRDYLGRRVDRCRGCGLLFMNPQYTEDYLADYYSRYYADSEEAGSIRAGDPDKASRQAEAKAARIQSLGRHMQPGRLLSIGCGDGLELLIAQKLGWQVEGFEIDPAYVEQLAGQLDFPIHGGDLKALQLPPASYDAVVMDQVLEHPKRPQDYLREAHRLLRPGGCLLVACPNLGSLSNRWKTLLGKCRVKRRRGRHYDMFHHLFFYRPSTLAAVMEREYGFDVVQVEGDPEGGRRTTADRLNQLRRRLPILESSFRLIARRAEPTISLN